MIIAQIFFRPQVDLTLREGSKMQLVLHATDWIHPDTITQDSQTSFLIYPVFRNIDYALPIPSVQCVFNENGSHTWNIILLSFPEENAGEKMPHLLSDSPPRWMEVLLECARDHYRPFLTKNVGAAISRILSFIDYPEAGSLDPKDLNKIHFTIACRWPIWEKANLSWDARAADLAELGVSFNKTDAVRNTDALEKQCRRIKLKKGTL